MLTIAGIPDESDQALHIGDDYKADFWGAKQAGKLQSCFEMHK